MKNIVLKVPTTIFVVLVLLPFIIAALELVANRELINSNYYGILGAVSGLVSSIWLFSMVDYFQSKTPEFKFTNLIYALLIFELFVNLLQSFDFVALTGKVDLILYTFRILIYITAVVFMVLLVRRVFYERATWFIVLELLIVIIGITTLSPEVKRNEQELSSAKLDEE